MSVYLLTISFIFLFNIFIGCTGPRIIIKESLVELKQAVMQDSNNYIAHYNLGLKYLSDKHYDKALEVFQQCLILRHNFAPAHFAIFCTEYAKDPDLFRESVKESPGEKMDEKIKKVDSHLAYAFFYDPFFDWRLGTVLLKSRPTIMDPIYDRIYDLLFEGFRLFFLGEYKESINQLNNTIKTFPKYTQARFFRGLAYSQLRNYEAAINDFRHVIEEMESYNKNKILPVYLNPAEIYYLVGYAYLQKGDFKNAKTSFQKVIVNDFSFYMAHFQLSNVYQQQQKYDRAIQELNAALTIEPNEAFIHFNKGVFLTRLRNYQAAIDEYKTTISINPNYYEAYFNLAVIQEALGDKKAAIKNYNQFIAKSPKQNEKYILKAKEKIELLSQN